MPSRRLTAEEQALWNAVAGTVRPIRPAHAAPIAPAVAQPPLPAKPAPKLTVAPQRPAPPPARSPAGMLDSSWERKIRGGTLSPDISIDLHGHSLSGAHARLNQAIASALAQELRILLIVTGKPRKSALSTSGGQRGAIRAEIGHWLGSGPYADRIASVRVAHPRHGGEGALYIILRRKN